MKPQLSLVLLSVLLQATTLSAADPGQRISSRTFPSVFQAWNPADNLTDADRWTTVARHDLVFHAPDFFGLRWDDHHAGRSTSFEPDSRTSALRLRNQLLQKNPNLIILAELRYLDAHSSYLPPNHAWWKRKDGQLVAGWEEGKYIQLDFSHPGFQRHVASQAKTVMDSQVFDGVMLDWWDDDEDRLQLIQAIRKAIGPNALILVNANDRTTPATAAFINGYYMECYRSRTVEDWQRIASTLQWAEKNLKEPRINCLEIWFEKSRRDLRLMRATTTLSLTMSDGYCLFADPNDLPTPDHLHDWYDFWNKRLGLPKAKAASKADGSYWREFDQGVVVYNPPGNEAVAVEFETPHTSASTNQSAKAFRVPSGDGDLFLKK